MNKEQLKRRRMKAHLKSQIAGTTIFKEEAQKVLRDCSDEVLTFPSVGDYYSSRDMCRATYLIYGYMRGKKYSELEPRARREPQWYLLRKLAFSALPWAMRVPSYVISPGREWRPTEDDLRGGIPPKLVLYIKEDMGEEVDAFRCYTEEEKMEVLRSVFPRGDHSYYYIEQWLQLEEWILEAKQHYRSQG